MSEKKYYLLVSESDRLAVDVDSKEEVYSTDLLDMGYEFKNIDFEELNQINEDSVGRIELKDTVIDLNLLF